MRSLGALTEISKHSPIPSLTASYQRALAHYCQLGVHGADVPWGSLEKSLQGAVREEAGVRGRAAAELQASFLSCRLALAARRLSQGKVSCTASEGTGAYVTGHGLHIESYTITYHTCTCIICAVYHRPRSVGTF